MHDAYTHPNKCVCVLYGEWYMNYNIIVYMKWHSKYANYFNNIFFAYLIMWMRWSKHLTWLPKSHHPISQLLTLSSRLWIKIGKFIPITKLKDILIFSFRFIIIISQYMHLKRFHFRNCLLSSKFSYSSFSSCFCPKVNSSRYFSLTWYFSLSCCCCCCWFFLSFFFFL